MVVQRRQPDKPRRSPSARRQAANQGVKGVMEVVGEEGLMMKGA